MKEFTLLLVLFSVWVSTAFSQADNQPNYLLNTKKFGVDLSVGPSFPYGDFGRKSASNDNSGFAKLGYKIEAGATYKLIDVINLNVMGFYTSNGTDLSDLQTLLGQRNPGTSWTAQSGRWDIFGGLVGLSLTMPITKKLTGSFKAYSGILNATIPELNVKGTNNSSYIQSKQTTSTFSYIVSLSVSYPLSRSFYWTSSADFIGATPNFNDVSIQSTINGVPQPVVKTSLSQNMQSFIIDTGITFVF
jgi:hypothetical protein